jgi:hypothetical protein
VGVVEEERGGAPDPGPAAGERGRARGVLDRKRETMSPRSASGRLLTRSTASSGSGRRAEREAAAEMGGSGRAWWVG